MIVKTTAAVQKRHVSAVQNLVAAVEHTASLRGSLGFLAQNTIQYPSPFRAKAAEGNTHRFGQGNPQIAVWSLVRDLKIIGSVH